MQDVVLVVHNVRSAHNVGSILRTVDGLGTNEVYLCGYTPYPYSPADTRLPHLAARTNRQIHKTALGAENSVIWHYEPNVKKTLEQLRTKGYRLAALEQTDRAIDLQKLAVNKKIALIVGSEIGGLDNAALNMCDVHVQIPMSGKKESLNVSTAVAIALYHFKYSS